MLLASLLEYPRRLYSYVDRQYGDVGLIVMGMFVVMSVVVVMIWSDRRR